MSGPCDLLGSASGVKLADDVLATDTMPFDAPCARQLAWNPLSVVALAPIRVGLVTLHHALV